MSVKNTMNQKSGTTENQLHKNDEIIKKINAIVLKASENKLKIILKFIKNLKAK